MVATGCDVADPFTTTMELAENPGTIVSAASPIPWGAPLAWSADGRRVHFGLEDGTLGAYDILTSQIAVLDGPRDEHAELVSAQAGDAVYFLADRTGDVRSAYRLSAGGDALRITDRAPGSGPISRAHGHLVLGGPDDRLVAYINHPDSLFLYEIETGDRRFIASGCVRAVAFSPDNERVLCKRPAAEAYGVFRLADGSVVDVSLQPAERESLLLRTRWSTEDSIHSLYRTQTRFRLRSTGSGNAYSLWLPLFREGVRATDFINWSWSADGRRFLFWSHECLKLDRVGGCEWGQSVLYAVDLTDNSGRPVAVVKGEEGAAQVAISPDGARVAFVFEGQLHTQIIS